MARTGTTLLSPSKLKAWAAVNLSESSPVYCSPVQSGPVEGTANTDS